MAKPERYAQNRFKKEAEKEWRGCEIVKQMMAGPFGTRGRSDDVFYGPYRCTIFFEWKRVGKVPTKLQKSRHRKLRRLGHKVYVVYQWQRAMEIAKREIETARLIWLLCPQAVSKGMHSEGSGQSRRWIPTSSGVG